MKVFLVWSGPVSKQAAAFLREWLQAALQKIRPWMSATDIGKGQLWRAELAKEIANSSFGIVCVTPANMLRPWLNFEAGALSADLDGGVSPLLIGLSADDLRSPLNDYQHTTLIRDSVWGLFETLNRRCEDPLPERTLVKTFEQWWPDLLEQIPTLEAAASEESAGKMTGPTEVEVRNELLQIARDSHRMLTGLAEKAAPGAINVSGLLQLLQAAARRSAGPPETPRQVAFPRGLRLVETPQGHFVVHQRNPQSAAGDTWHFRSVDDALAQVRAVLTADSPGEGNEAAPPSDGPT